MADLYTTKFLTTPLENEAVTTFREAQRALNIVYEKEGVQQGIPEDWPSPTIRAIRSSVDTHSNFLEEWEHEYIWDGIYPGP